MLPYALAYKYTKLTAKLLRKLSSIYTKFNGTSILTVLHCIIS